MESTEDMVIEHAGGASSDSSLYAYDLFVVYAADDRAFVHDHLLPPLQLAPARVHLIDELMLGGQVISEIARGVARSRYTVVVLSEAYLRDRWAMFGAQLASYQSVEDVHVIPLRLTDCKLPLDLEFRVALDFRQASRWSLEIERLRALLHGDGRTEIPTRTIARAEDRFLTTVVARHEDIRREHPSDLQKNVLDFFVEPAGSTEPAPPEPPDDHPATTLWSLVTRAIEDRSPCAVLADFGLGKSWFAQMTEYRIARAALSGDGDRIHPLLFHLRSFRRAAVPSALISLLPFLGSAPASLLTQVRDRAWSTAYGESAVRTQHDQLLGAFEAGRQVLLLDGLDEMQRDDAQALLNEVSELSRSTHRSAIVITCRRSFFRDFAAEKHLSDLGFRVFYSLSWSRAQVVEYLDRAHRGGALSAEPATVMTRLDGVRGARDITSRALLAAMLVAQWEDIDGDGRIDVPSLYTRHVERELLRWQSVRLQQLSIEQLQWFMEEFAMLMFQLDRRSISTKELSAYLSKKFGDIGLDRFSPVAEAITGEIRTNSLLLRHDMEYFFCHPSFCDFLVARLLLRSLKENDLAPFEILHRSKQYREIIESFLIPMLPSLDLVERLFMMSPTNQS